MFLLANCFAKIHLCIEKTKVINDNRSKLKTKKTMDKITKINSGEKFTHTSVGKLAEFNGKQFLKDTVGTTGCEISFGTIEPGQAAPFFHIPFYTGKAEKSLFSPPPPYFSFQ